MNTQHFRKYVYACLMIVSMGQNAIGMQALAVELQENNQEHYSTEYFYNPIKFLSSGIQCFFKHIYNRPEYVTDFLPHNFTHFEQFLANGAHNNHPAMYSRSVVKLFGQKLKAVRYINFQAFSDFLGNLPQLIKHHFTTETEQDSFSQLSSKLNQLLYDKFLHKFDQFQTDPDDFFAELTQEIQLAVETRTQNEVEKEQLRQTVIRCLDVCINRLMWSPKDQAGVWESFKTILTQIDKLHEAKIILDLDDVDDLVWSLIHRFNYFIDQLGSYLSPDVYELMKEDILGDRIPLLALEEQEPLIRSKKDFILRDTIWLGQAKARQQFIAAQ